MSINGSRCFVNAIYTNITKARTADGGTGWMAGKVVLVHLAGAEVIVGFTVSFCDVGCMLGVYDA